MKTRVTVPAIACLLICLGLAVPAVAQGLSAEPSVQGEGALKVMTYNVYVGSEFVGVTNPDYASFMQAMTNAALDIRASDPRGRAQAVARLIAATRPHLVSLQEVATLSTGTTKDNLTVEFDYLQLLLQALAEQGVQYTMVVSNITWTATAPYTLGYVRFTWGVAILARADLKPEHFSFTNVAWGNWSPAATLSVPLPALNGSPDCPIALQPSGACVMPMPRGWASADVTYRGKSFRIISAHLESASASRNIRQGLELLNGPANIALPVAVAADLNADCSNPSDSKYATCVNFSDRGFLDAWTVANPLDPGYSRDVPNMTIRSDYVMVRGPFAVQTACLVGEEEGDKTSQTYLWPSDHAGVVVKMEPPEEE